MLLLRGGVGRRFGGFGGWRRRGLRMLVGLGEGPWWLMPSWWLLGVVLRLVGRLVIVVVTLGVVVVTFGVVVVVVVIAVVRLL